MYLKTLIIANYKSSRGLILNLNPNEPNILIGLNDCGKSTILSSIDLLLGEKPTYNSLSEGKYKSDLSNSPLTPEEFKELLSIMSLPELTYTNDQSFILGQLVFSNEELDEFKTIELSSTLAWVLDNSSDNEIWIAKTYKNSNSQFYILTHDSAELNKLWELGATDLNKFLKEEGITAEQIQNENGKGRFSNLEKIRAGYLTKTLSTVWTPYKFAKADKQIFPEFKYFDWNCSFDDINAIANAIMKEFIDSQLEPLKKNALKAAEEAEKEINQKFGELANVIQSVAKGVENVTSKVHFDVKEKISDIMVQKKNSDGFVHLESQGEGLKRQIWFSLIKSKAESNPRNGFKDFIWAFDEPETHLYPGAQRELFETLRNISYGNVQTLISTHSTVFIDKSKIDRIYSVTQDTSGYTSVDYCSDVDSIYATLNVRNSDFLFYDKFLIVEGDTEQHLIPKLFQLYSSSTLVDHNIQLININGKDKWAMNKAIIDKVMAGFKKSEDQLVFLFDNDMSHEIGKSAITPNMFFVGKQDIEDSIQPSIWRELINDKYKGQIEVEEEAIAELIERVPEGKACRSHEKFYHSLNRLLSKKWVENGQDIDQLENLPSKGLDSSEFILSKLIRKEQIPLVVSKAFDKLLNL